MQNHAERLAAALQGRYTIEQEVGQGGMATVYLAHDVRHNRKVAVKVLRPELAAVIGAERFLKEIEVTAQLQHPHILPLFDSGEADSFLYYVMPYIEGESLREKLTREKQLGLDETIEITRAVSSALDYAHRRGVIHRDIKPENVLLHDRQPVVADFGIALAVSHAGGARITETGLSLGTPHYMSPEQATADRELDARSDIYSLGAIVYEMLTGDPPHSGSSAQAIVASVLTEEPRRIVPRRKNVPPYVENAVLKSLAKLPADRFASAGDFATALTTATIAVTGAAPVASPDVTRWKRVAIASVAVVLALLATTLWALRRSSPAPVYRLNVAFPDDAALHPASTLRFALSPDGSRLVYTGPGTTAPTQLWIRDFDDLEGRPLPGTDDALAPFFSPDGASIGFFSGQPGDLRVMAIDRGAIQTLVSARANSWGGAWGDDGHIYFGELSGNMARVSLRTGAVEPVTTLDVERGESEHDWPRVIAGTNAILYQVWRGSLGDAEIAVVDLASGQMKRLMNGIVAEYVSSGHLVWVTGEGLLQAAAFDTDRLELVGPTMTLEEAILLESFAGVPELSLSASGHLAYQPGAAGNRKQIEWVDRDGRATQVDPEWVGDFKYVRLSPDGRRLAFTEVSPDGEQLWVRELDTGSETLLTFEGSSNYRPAWTPDGRNLSFVSNRSILREVWQTRADGSSVPQLIARHPEQIDEVAWSPDGVWLLYRTGTGGARTRDIFGIKPGVDTVPRPLVTSSFDDFSPKVSPDGRWLAYTSNEGGREEVYVRPFPDTDSARWTVSVGGGSEPVWARSGRELFYRTSRGEMVAAQIARGDSFAVERVDVLFTTNDYARDSYHDTYDVTADGQRFVMVRVTNEASGAFVFVLNWAEDLERRMAAQ